MFRSNTGGQLAKCGTFQFLSGAQTQQPDETSQSNRRLKSWPACGLNYVGLLKMRGGGESKPLNKW